MTPWTDAPVIHNQKIAALMRPEYTPAELGVLRNFLVQKDVFSFSSLPNGLFSAAASAAPGDVSGYHYVWVRDNVHVAHAHYVCGDKAAAGRTLSALMQYFQKHQRRFQAVIEDQKKTLATDPMNRPHIRFDGTKLEEVSQTWAHVQNDALGIFLWFYCKLAQEDVVKSGEQEWECLARFALFFRAVEYWQDQDSGHWEEARKVSASSIGPVVAGLQALENLLGKKQLWSHPVIAGKQVTPEWIRELRRQGAEALDVILPCESIEPKSCYRRYDSALLFSIYPLEVIPWDMARVILEDVKAHLQGAYGIRRYLGDSYWFPDYKEKIKAEQRTGDFSDNMSERNAGLKPGEEAQWCIFDPIISVIYGKRHRLLKSAGATTEASEALHMQTVYFNRALGQLTGESKNLPELRAAELYYLEKGRYVPNDHTPLLWSQANLWLAVHQMQRSVE